MKKKEFEEIFNRSFWRAFNDKLFPIFEKIEKDEKESILNNLYNDIKEKNYYPSIPRNYIYQNKWLWVARVVPVFEIKDYCLYYYCIKKLENKIAFNRVENTYWGWTLWWQIRQKEEEEIKNKVIKYNEFEDDVISYLWISHPWYSFNPQAWSKAYWDFNSKLFMELNSGSYKNVVEFDIANFYDNIRLDILELKIKEISNREESIEVSLLFHFLQYWNRELNNYNKKTVWLPQDALADCSRILSNFYLQEYDDYMFTICKKYNCTYFRYCDDQFILWEDKSILREILFLSSKKLNSIWLNINQKKVKEKTVKELIDYRSFSIFDIVEWDSSKDIENVECFLDKYFELRDSNEYYKLKSKWVSILNRALSCNIKDIELNKKIKFLWYVLEDDFLLSAEMYKFDKIYNLLWEPEKLAFLKKLNTLSENYIHNHFHYELIRFYKKIKVDYNKILERISIIDNL